jgi:hypothetical protein
VSCHAATTHSSFSKHRLQHSLLLGMFSSTAPCDVRWLYAAPVTYVQFVLLIGAKCLCGGDGGGGGCGAEQSVQSLNLPPHRQYGTFQLSGEIVQLGNLKATRSAR